MRKLVLLLLAIGSFILCMSAASSLDPELTIDIRHMNFAYPAEGCEFSRKHFSNMRTYYFLGATQSALLRNGHYANKWTGYGSSEADFESFSLLPSEQEQSPFALAIYSWEWVGGSSSQSWAAQVFTFANGKLKVVQQITNDSHHFPKTAAWYDPSTKVLTIKSNRYGKGANCCPEQLDVMELRWDGSESKRVSLKTIPHPK